MQISKLPSGKIKNFRIQLKTQLLSKQKEKNRSQSQQIKDHNDKFTMKKDDICHNEDNAIKSKRSLSIISLLNQAKVTKLNHDHSKFTNNVKKQILTLDSKQRILTIANNKTQSKIKEQQVKRGLITKKQKPQDCQEQKQNFYQDNPLNQNILNLVQNQINSINRKKSQKLSLTQKKLYEDELNKNQRQKIQIIQQISKLSSQKQIQNELIKNQKQIWQENFKNVFFKEFRIAKQFSLNIASQKNLPNKISIGVQTSSIQQTQDKYFLQYVKYRQLKIKHYEQVQQKQKKINQLIQQSLQFSNHYKLVVDCIDRVPFTDREKRVFYMGKQLQAAQIKVKQTVSKVHKFQQESQKYLQKIIPQLQNKKHQLYVSITNLIRAFLLQKQKLQKRENKYERKVSNQNHQQKKRQKTFCNILSRVLDQFRFLKQLDMDQCSKISQMIGQYQKEVKQFQKSYIQWSGLFYQSRVLVYNFMRQIQKIPAIMTELFGFRSKQEIQKSFSPQKQFEEYMSAKCEQCYHTNKKVKFLQATNEQIKPILKSLEWLIRDMNKKGTCISII